MPFCFEINSLGSQEVSAPGLRWGLRQALSVISQGNTTEGAEPKSESYCDAQLSQVLFIYVLETY